MHQDFAQLGRDAMEVMLAVLTDELAPNPLLRVPQLVVRASTAPPPGLKQRQDNPVGRRAEGSRLQRTHSRCAPARRNRRPGLQRESGISCRDDTLRYVRTPRQCACCVMGRWRTLIRSCTGGCLATTTCRRSGVQMAGSRRCLKDVPLTHLGAHPSSAPETDDRARHKAPANDLVVAIDDRLVGPTACFVSQVFRRKSWTLLKQTVDWWLLHPVPSSWGGSRTSGSSRA